MTALSFLAGSKGSYLQVDPGNTGHSNPMEGPCGDSCKPWTICGVTKAPLPFSDSAINNVTAKAYTKSTDRRQQFIN